MNISETLRERRESMESCPELGDLKRIKKRRKLDEYGRNVNTREYAIAWGVLNKPYSYKDLYNKCRAADAPSFHFITKECWKGYVRYYNALVKAGMPPRPPRNDSERRMELAKKNNDCFKTALLEKDYDAVRMAAEYGVSSLEDYNRIRKEKPESKVFLPKKENLVRHFGSWRRFMYEVMKYNADAVLTQYVSESAACGHWLRISECDRMKIPIRKLMDVLRPTLFNALCYRKLDLMGLRDKIKKKDGSNED